MCVCQTVDTKPLCEWNYMIYDLLKLIAMKGRTQEIRRSKTDDITQVVTANLREQTNITRIDRNSSGISSHSDNDADEELQKFAHLLIENCPGGNRQSVEDVEKELEKFAHLLIEETTDLYYKTRGSGEGSATSKRLEVKPFSSVKVSEVQAIKDKKVEKHGFQTPENVEKIEDISMKTKSDYKETEPCHRKAKLTHRINDSERFIIHNRIDKHDTRQLQGAERPVRQCDPYLWQPESNVLQENIVFESIDKQFASSCVSSNGSSSLSSFKENGDTCSSDYNYVIPEDDLLLPGILSCDETKTCDEFHQMNTERNKGKEEDIPVRQCETVDQTDMKTLNTGIVVKIQMNDAIKARINDLGVKRIAVDNKSENEPECFSDSSAPIGEQFSETICGQTCDEKNGHAMRRDTNESQVLGTKSVTQTSDRQILNEPNVQKSIIQNGGRSYEDSKHRNLFECIPYADNRTVIGPEIRQTSEADDYKTAMRFDSDNELDYHLNQIGTPTQEGYGHEQTVSKDTSGKTSTNKLECAADSLRRVIQDTRDAANQQTYEQDGSQDVSVMEHETASDKSKSTSVRPSQMKESLNEQVDANSDGEDLIRTSGLDEVRCVTDKSVRVEATTDEQAEESINAHVDANSDGEYLKRTICINGMECVTDRSYQNGATTGKQAEESINEHGDANADGEHGDANADGEDLKRTNSVNEMKCSAGRSDRTVACTDTQADGNCGALTTVRSDSARELESIIDSPDIFVKNKRQIKHTYANESYQNVRRNESFLKQESLADSTCRSKQGHEHVNAPYMARHTSTKTDSKPIDNETVLIKKIDALNLSKPCKRTGAKSVPRDASATSGTRIMLSRKNINDMNRVCIKKVNTETTCIFSLKSYRKVRPCVSTVDFLLFLCSTPGILRNPPTIWTRDSHLAGIVKCSDFVSVSSPIKCRRFREGLVSTSRIPHVAMKLSTKKRENENTIKQNACDDSCKNPDTSDTCDNSDCLDKDTVETVKGGEIDSNAKEVEMNTDKPEQDREVDRIDNKGATFVSQSQHGKHSDSSKCFSVDSITNKLNDIAVSGDENIPEAASQGTSYNMKFLEFIGASSNSEHESVIDNDDTAGDERAKERKTYLDEDLDDDEIDGKRNYSVDEKLASNKYNKSFVVTDLNGEDFNLKYLQEHGLQDPIYFKDKTGLGLRVPSQNFQVSDVKACVGSRRMLDVMDVTTQKGMEMSMKEWVKYYENPEKDKLLNVISLEFSHTKLENYVESPSLVREVDWVDIAWPQHLKDCQTESTNVIDKMKYPKVQKYCLMSVKGCFTDFHIDFGGTSVWYHILHGEKVFWLIPPTPKNLATYENWVLSAKQGDVFLGDIISDCQKITLVAGSTFIIPSGWIHAVYTPKDSLVFGGNFLHSFNIDKQLTVAAIEEKTHVPGKFRYPFYAEIGWYVLERYVHCITGQTYLEKPKLSDELELMSGMSTSPESPLYDDFKPDTPKLEQEITTPKLSKRVAVTLTRIDSQSPRRVSSSDDDSMASGPPRSPQEASDGHRLNRKSSTESSTSVADSNADSKHSKMVPNVPKGKENSSVRKKDKSVFMTKYEKIGLTKLVQWIEDLPPSKKGIPKDLLNPEAVMREIKRILEEHMNDSEKMAATGHPILVWTKATKKLIKMKQKAKLLGSSHVAKGTGKASKGTGDRHRRVRCKKCEPCTRDDCRECNFCKDMKKYGGPGRMKQSCISRQCLAPCLANSATCKICNKDMQKKDVAAGDESTTLMECGVCWEIVHPACLKVKDSLEGEGVVNEDLPNSWICIKCNADGKQQHLKPRVFKGGWRPSPAATPSPVASPNPDVHPIGEDVVTEGKRVVSKQPADPPKVILPKSSSDPTAASSSIQSNTLSPWQHTFEKSVSVKSETTVAGDGENSEVDMEVEESKPVPKPASQTILVKKSVKRKSLATPEDTEKSQKKPKLSASVPPKGKGKSPKPSKPPTLSQSASGKKAKKSPLDDTNPLSLGPPTLGRPKREDMGHVTHPNPSTSYDFDEDEFLDNETITLPHLEKGKGAIAKSGKRQKTGKMFRSHGPEVHNPGGGGSGAVGASSLKLDLSGSPVNKFSLRKKPDDIGKVLLEHIEKRGLKVVPQKYVVRPIPVSPTKTYTEMVGGEKHPLPYIVWTKIFSYLSQADLARCLCVCRIWNRWCINPELWKEIDLSRNRIVQNHLMGIVRRQPESLILSSVIMTPKQLTWIVERIPLLKKLVLSKCSWATMSGLCTSACPLLTELDISWATGISDQFFEDLITPPVDRKPAVKNISRLHRLKILRIAGTEITDQAIELMTVHLSRLEVLDLSFCTRITDHSVQSLANPKSATQETLKVLTLSGCRQLTDASLQKIKNFKHLSHLNMAGCNKVSADGFRHFRMHGLVQFIH